MVESCNLQRRRLLAALAMTPLLPGVAVRAAERRELTLTLTGQALIAHDLCHEPYPGLAEVIAQSAATNAAAHDLGWTGATPFLTMAFLALSVIPSLKITDRGLVDVERFELVPLTISA